MLTVVCLILSILLCLALYVARVLYQHWQATEKDLLWYKAELKESQSVQAQAVKYAQKVESNAFVIDPDEPLALDEVNKNLFYAFREQGMWGQRGAIEAQLTAWYGNDKKQRPKNLQIWQGEGGLAAAWVGRSMQPPMGVYWLIEEHERSEAYA